VSGGCFSSLLLPLAGGKNEAQAQDHFVGAECLVGLPFVNVEAGVSRIVQLTGILQVDMPEESGPQGPFRAGIPSPQLETLVIFLAEQAVLCVRDDRAHSEFSQEVHFYFFVMGLIQVPAFCDIKEQEICSVVEKVVEPVGLIECNRAIYGVVIQPSFDMSVLIGDDVFGVIEVDLESPAFLFIQQKTKTVIILGNGDRFLEQAFVPTFVIVGPDAFESVVVAQGRLGDMQAAMCIPFCIVSPGYIHFLYKVFLFPWRWLLLDETRLLLLGESWLLLLSEARLLLLGNAEKRHKREQKESNSPVSWVDLFHNCLIICWDKMLSAWQN